MHKFKVGDKLDYLPRPDWNGAVVESLYFNIDKLGYYVNHPEQGFGLMYEHQVAAHNPAPSLSDQELADKYRALRAEALQIGDQLRERGYSAELKRRSEGFWRPVVPRTSGDYEFRFTKTETTTKAI